MRSKFDTFIFGFILIAAGGLLMARNMGYEIDLTPAFGMVVFAGLSALCFIRYIVGDLRRWGRLMPACLFAAVAVMIGLSQADVRDTLITAPLFIGFTITFVAAFFSDPPKTYWAAIPAVVFGLLTVTMLIGEQATGNLFTALVAILIAIPFFVGYFLQPKLWWAIIPAGIFVTIAALALVSALSPAFDHSSLKNALGLLGLAVTFGMVYGRRDGPRADWAKYPAIFFGLLIPVALLEHTSIDGGPLVLIGLGVIVLVASLRPRRAIMS